MKFQFSFTIENSQDASDAADVLYTLWDVLRYNNKEITRESLDAIYKPDPVAPEALKVETASKTREKKSQMPAGPQIVSVGLTEVREEESKESLDDLSLERLQERFRKTASARGVGWYREIFERFEVSKTSDMTEEQLKQALS